MTDVAALTKEIEELREAYRALRGGIAQRFLGQGEVCELLLTCLVAGGHTLLEGAPGLGKTTLVRTLSQGLHLEFRRVQFTPDLMPPDILGSRILETSDDGSREFHFVQGPIFTQVLLADEINRSTPRTQSALLEAMQERQVTAFGETYTLPQPFFVIATQNPIEMEGTYPLPEAQLDRFLMKIDLKLPNEEDLARILASTTSTPEGEIEAVMDQRSLLRLQELAREVPASSDMLGLAARTVHATHPSSSMAPDDVQSLVRYGASPRAGQALVLAAKARALLRGGRKLFVTREDLEAMAPPTFRHRLILGYEGEASGISPDELVLQAFQAAARKSS